GRWLMKMSLVFCSERQKPIDDCNAILPRDSLKKSVVSHPRLNQSSVWRPLPKHRNHLQIAVNVALHSACGSVSGLEISVKTHGRPNVKLTGAARLYRAPSSPKGERLSAELCIGFVFEDDDLMCFKIVAFTQEMFPDLLNDRP